MKAKLAGEHKGGKTLLKTQKGTRMSERQRGKTKGMRIKSALFCFFGEEN